MSTTVLTHGRVTWTNIIQPTLQELNQLGERYPQFHPLNLHDCLTPLEFPKLDQHDDYIFIVAQLPRWDPQEQLSIALRHILRPQLDVIRELERGDWPFIHEDLNLYWGDISSHLAQQRAMLDEHFDVINGLSDTIHTLASHRIDEVVRLLTLITILTVPLTLISTVFGMNVQLPYGSHPLPFFAINALGIVATVLLLWYLRKRGWF
jgi:Mg2+ and Co2+ transporter CorA